MGGAIIHVIYEILRIIGKLNKCFSSDEIIDKYKELKKKKGYFKKLIKAFRRNGRGENLLTLEDDKRLKKWLREHTYTKPVFWFDKCKEKDSFKLKKNSERRLKHERKRKGFG